MSPDETEAELPDPFRPDWGVLESAATESPFMETGVELLKEVTAVALLAAGLVTQQPYGRDEAVRLALLLRLGILGRSLLIDVCEGFGDQQLALARQVIDTAATIRLLTYDVDGSMHEAFVVHSLISEREFLRTISTRQKQDGEPLPIEERMERSIRRAGEAAGIPDISSLPSRPKSGWPSAERRIGTFGPAAYVAYRAGSNAIHGGWSDLLRNHLQQVDGGFLPNFDGGPPRPQPLFACALLSAAATQDYLSRRPDLEREFVDDHLADLLDRLQRADRLHEAHLQKS